jgi:hypothetical protein
LGSLLRTGGCLSLLLHDRIPAGISPGAIDPLSVGTAARAFFEFESIDADFPDGLEGGIDKAFAGKPRGRLEALKHVSRKWEPGFGTKTCVKTRT